MATIECRGRRSKGGLGTFANPVRLYLTFSAAQVSVNCRIINFSLGWGFSRGETFPDPSDQGIALCVLVKSKDTSIEWHVVKRTAKELSEYLAKVGWTAEAIASGRYYKRPGFWCSWCDYLPVCLGNKGKVKATLVQGNSLRTSGDEPLVFLCGWLLRRAPGREGFYLTRFLKLCLNLGLSPNFRNDNDFARLTDVLFLHGFLPSRDAF
ncbi:MAG: PD-(D/E)XK nuclease family protein [Planctomycetes bacterium]|nr:PD-(D/E)XK nuclease family protein [Planctomycetota bacterium]